MRMDIPWAISHTGFQFRASALASAPGLWLQLVGAEKSPVPDLTGLQEAPKRAAAICAQIGDQIGWNTFNKHLVCSLVHCVCRYVVCHPEYSPTRMIVPGAQWVSIK